MSLFHSLPKEKKEEVLGRLSKFQDGKCFLCEEYLGMVALESLEVDHIIPFAEGGRDDKSNWALLHKDCNRKKGVKPLLLARSLHRFEKDKRKFEEKFKLGKVLEAFRGTDGNDLKIKFLGENRAEILYKNEKGLN